MSRSTKTVRAADTVQNGGQLVTLDATPVRMLDLNVGLKAYMEAVAPPTSLTAGTLADAAGVIENAKRLETTGRIIQGWQLASIKSMGAEAFSVICGRCRIPRSSAYEMMDLFAQYQRAKDLEVIQLLVDMGAKKTLALKQWTNDDLEALAHNKEARGLSYERVQELTPEQLREWRDADQADRIAKLEMEKIKLHNQLDTERNRANLLARAGATLLDEADLPRFALTVRQESLALTEQIGWAIDNLDTVVEENLLREVKHPEAHRWQPVSASTCFYALAGALARGHALLERIREAYPDHHLTAEVQLRPAEITRFQEQRAQLLATHEAKTRQRETARENATPGKRGAKRKG
jgi:hypothetical protein